MPYAINSLLMRKLWCVRRMQTQRQELRSVNTFRPQVHRDVLYIDSQMHLEHSVCLALGFPPPPNGLRKLAFTTLYVVTFDETWNEIIISVQKVDRCGISDYLQHLRYQVVAPRLVLERYIAQTEQSVNTRTH